MTRSVQIFIINWWRVNSMSIDNLHIKRYNAYVVYVSIHIVADQYDTTPIPLITIRAYMCVDLSCKEATTGPSI